MSKRIIFDKESSHLILKAFGCSVRDDGYILNKDGEIVCCPEGEELTIETFGGIKRSDCGKPMFLKNDLLTTIKLSEDEYH